MSWRDQGKMSWVSISKIRGLGLLDNKHCWAATGGKGGRMERDDKVIIRHLEGASISASGPMVVE